MKKTSNKKKKNWLSYALYRIIRFFVKLFYPKITVEGYENLGKEAGIIVGNHTKMNGPISTELYFPAEKSIWCAAQMMKLREVPPYAFEDFWSHKPKKVRWFYKLLSYFIAPFSVSVFNNAHTIPVYRDSKFIITFRKTMEAIQGGKNVIIFPECSEPHNNIVNNFQDGFIDIAKTYYKRTGVAIEFTPLYIAPNLKKMCIGKPTRFNPDLPIDEERARICLYLMDEITKMAMALPRHIVVPYDNIPKNEYKYNKNEEGQL